MSPTTLPTDTRILYLLRCGEDFHSLLDPEGISSSGFVSNLFLSAPSDEGNIVWCMKISFESGDILQMNGTYSEIFNSIIERIKFIPFQGEVVLLSEKPANRLFFALGDLSALPAQLKRNLAPTGLKSVDLAADTRFFNESVYKIAVNALFWGVDGGKREDGFRQSFGSVSFTFKQNQDGLPYQLDLVSKLGLGYGRISVKTTVDVYGLSGKSVMLDVEQAGGEIISCKCSKRVTEKVIPSVRVAFELLDKFSDQKKMKQRRKKVSMGKPKFK